MGCFPNPATLLFGLAFLGYLGSARIISRIGTIHPLWIWLVAIALRMIFLPLEPILSDDIYRYLWDGHVQLQGINPYTFAPSDPALESIRTPWYHLINNPDISTIYPPLAQLLFLGVAIIGTSVFKMKLLWVLVDLAAGAVLMRYAKRTDRNPSLVGVLYLWSPLLIVEVAWSGHLDPLGIMSLVTLLALTARPALAGLAGAAATLTKFAPLAALPPLALRMGKRFPIVLGLAVLVLYLPYLNAGSQLWAGLTTFAEHWRANEGLFLVVESFFGEDPMPPRRAVGALVLMVVAWTTWRRYDPERALFWIFGAGILLSPTVHPWYVLWILPFAALRSSPGFILLTGLIFLGYWGLGAYQGGGLWEEPIWTRFLIWIPVWSLIALDALQLRHPPRHPQPSPSQG